jgi:hypothetical protein
VAGTPSISRPFSDNANVSPWPVSAARQHVRGLGHPGVEVVVIHRVGGETRAAVRRPGTARPADTGRATVSARGPQVLRAFSGGWAKEVEETVFFQAGGHAESILMPFKISDLVTVDRERI